MILYQTSSIRYQSNKVRMGRCSKKEREKNNPPSDLNTDLTVLNASQCSLAWLVLKHLTQPEALCFFVLISSIQGEAERPHRARGTGRIGPGRRVRNSQRTCLIVSCWNESIMVVKIIVPSPQASCPGIEGICQPQLSTSKAARPEVWRLLVEGNAAAADSGLASGRLLLRLLPLASKRRQCSRHSVT